MLVKELQATWEHAKAKSNGGSNSINNLLVLCSKCNAERANLPYPFILRIHPDIAQNVQKQKHIFPDTDKYPVPVFH